VRNGIAEVGLRLFLERGFDEVTAAEIARSSGISPRSFFRYFATKEDAALAGLEEGRRRVLAALTSRPPDEGAWQALKHAFSALIEIPVAADLDPLNVARLFIDTPSLRARRFEKNREWSEALLPPLRERLPPPVDEWRGDTAVRAIIAAALGCLDTATEIWVATDGAVPAPEILDQAFNAVAASVEFPR
jgi:AcrR family transcriptional regulator